MPQITINYKRPETLKILKALAKELDFQVSISKGETALVKKAKADKEDLDNKILKDIGIGIDAAESEKRLKSILVPGNPDIDITELKEIFSGSNIDARQLRKQAWERKR